MDKSALYKRMCFRAKEIQEAWIPQAGDFWYCSCSSCLMSNSIWVIERPDLMAIDPKYTYEYMKLHYSRDTVSQVMTSRDCGFGPFWFNWKIEKELGHAWLPRFDQLLNFAKLNESLGQNVAWQISDLLDYINKTHQNEESTIEQLALSWIMEKVYNKRYKENSDHPIIQDEPPEPIVVPEELSNEMAMYYELTRMPRKRCGGDWFEIKTA